MDCQELDEPTHAVLAVVSSAYKPKTGVSKYTGTHVREELGIQTWRELQEMLAELQELKFIKYENNSIRILEFCRCDPRKILEASRMLPRTGNGYWGLPLHGSPPNQPASHPPLGNSGYHTTPTTPKEHPFFGVEENSEDPQNTPPTLQGRHVEKSSELDKKPPEQWSTMGFARYFSREIKNLAWKVNFIPVAPKQKMSRQFSLWFKEGMDRRTVKLMIDEFCGDPKWMKENLGVRQSFFYNKDRLYKEVARKQQREKHKERDSDDNWGY